MAARCAPPAVTDGPTVREGAEDVLAPAWLVTGAATADGPEAGADQLDEAGPPLAPTAGLDTAALLVPDEGALSAGTRTDGVEAGGVETEGVETEGVVATGVLTDGTVTDGTVTEGTLTVGNPSARLEDERAPITDCESAARRAPINTQRRSTPKHARLRAARERMRWRR